MRMCVLVLLLSFFAFTAMAMDPAVVIQDAQKAAVAKNRKTASNKILNALKSEHSAKSKAKLLDALKTLADVFFTDQGQRLFETAQSMAYENADTALARFNESLALEDGNVVVLLSMARVQLAKKDCSGADARLRAASEINPYDKTLRFLKAKTLLCLKKPEEALALLKAEPADDPVSNVTLAAALFGSGSSHEATTLLQKTISKDSSFPEAHYWIWKISSEEGDAVEEQGQKYIALCKNLNLRTRRKYINEPCLCGQTQEVDDALKASQKSTDT